MIIKNTFICPDCGQQIKIDQGKVLSIVTSSDVDTSKGYNPYRTTIITKWYNVRFCNRCAKRINLNHYARHFTWYLIPSIVMNVFAQKISFGTLFLPLFIAFMLHPLAITIYRDIKMNFFTPKLINKAFEGDAIC